MKVKMIFAVEDNRKTYKVGEIHDLDDELAKCLIREGRAEPAKSAPAAPAAPKE
jgi:hypothetical protein